MIWTLILVVQLGDRPETAVYPGCTAADMHSLEATAAMILRSDRPSDAPVPDRGVSVSSAPCAALSLSRVALGGWDEARRLAPRGGAAELLKPAQQAIADLEAWAMGEMRLEAGYAQASLRAAIAAAQDERPEMQVWLDHARDLAERLVARGRRAAWPRPFNLLAGELWFEVDRYDEARRAFERAVRAEESPLARVGLAQSLSRLERRDEACAVAGRVRDATGRLREQLQTILAMCP